MKEITNQTLHEILVRVEKAVVKTNGRVSSIEDWKSEQRGALNVIKLILVPIILAIIISFVV